MKKRIILCLIAIFVFLSSGIAISILYITGTTKELTNIIQLHQVEQLRRSLLLSVQTVQTNLYSVNTPHSHTLDIIVNNVNLMNKSAAECNNCHHSPELLTRIMRVQSLIKDYETKLSYYITTTANEDRMTKIKGEAAGIGEAILSLTEEMSHSASKSLQDLTTARKKEAEKVKYILSLTILLCLLLSILVAIILTRSVTNPISKLLSATGKIASGEYGATVDYKGKNEFGKLASHFNQMSSKISSEIAERMKTENSLRESEERYALAARGANDGLWDWDLSAGIIYFSSRWKSMLGFSDNEISENIEEWYKRIHPDDVKGVKAEMTAHINGIIPQFQNEHRIKHKDGSYRWMLSRGLAVSDDSGKVHRMAGSITDITEKKINEEQLIYDAFHDALTNLPNRALFMDRLTHAINRSLRDSRKFRFAVLFIDIDRFKVVNDSLGHLLGDKLLIQVSYKLQESLRPGDTVARLGGDEFAILLEDIKDASDVTHLIERISAAISAPFSLDGNEVFITISTGISFSDVNYAKPEELLRNADIAMYHAKTNGRDRHEIFTPLMYESVVASMQLQTDMRRALENKEFRLYYQPIISIETKKLAGFEALIRWEHPVRGILSPNEFIPLAEETGMILPIGEWVIDEACRQLCDWHKQCPCETPLTVSINISSKQVTQGLVDQMKRILSDTGINPNSVILEITESVLMDNPSSVTSLLTQLKEMDIQLHIDDFGTGYSSLSYLHDLPIDALKIDRSFVSKLSISGEKHEIVGTITELARNLKMAVTAEGIETHEQFDKIRTLNCRHIQGFLFSKPLDSKAIELILKNIDKDYFV
ncbi:MAG: EAL domain-containing protein [Nitrospirae bacterium]|nr:EAL domain-containing protein [Nitrospirota bacterium]